MDTISSSRLMRRALLPAAAFAVVVAFVCVAADMAAAAPPSSAIQKLASCMKAKGYAGRPTQADRASAKYNTAHQACAKQAGLTGTGANGANTKYISCMKKHGITITPAKKPNRTSVAYKKADAACASQRKS